MLNSSKILELLSSLGLVNYEPNIYLAALTLGTSPASNIGKKCNIPRSTARYTCEQLVKKQIMIESQKGNTKLFTIENPEKLQKLLEIQKSEIQKKEDSLNVALQELKRLHNPYTIIPKVKFYEGLEGVKSVLNDSLTSKTELLVFSDLKGYTKYLLDYNKNEYAPKRKELKIFERAIVPNTKDALNFLKGYENIEGTSIVLVDSKKFPLYSEVNIYDNKVSYVTFSEQGHVGIIIENKDIYETHRSIFEMNWGIGKIFLNKKD